MYLLDDINFLTKNIESNKFGVCEACIKVEIKDEKFLLINETI